MHYKIERLNIAGRWLKARSGEGRKHKLLSDAQLEAAVARERGSVVRVVRVMQDGSREVVEG
jgi:hypothetical protein